MLAEEWVLVLGESATVGVMPERPMIKAKVKTASWVFMDISQKFGLTMMARRSGPSGISKSAGIAPLHTLIHPLSYSLLQRHCDCAADTPQTWAYWPAVW